jgi:hypothetical protein
LAIESVEPTGDQIRVDIILTYQAERFKMTVKTTSANRVEGGNRFFSVRYFWVVENDRSRLTRILSLYI